MTNDAMTQWLTVCRQDIAHLTGDDDVTTNEWVSTNLAEAITRFNEALQMQSSGSEEAIAAASADGLDEVEAAYQAVKVWSQDIHYRSYGNAL